MLTIGPNITIHGKTGSVYDAFGNGGLVNQGTIGADAAGGTINLGGNSHTPTANQGTINVGTGRWASTAASRSPACGTSDRTRQALVDLAGTLDLGGGTLGINAATGSWNLLGGSIRNGAVSESGGALLAFTNSGGTLTSITFDGDMGMFAAAGRRRRGSMAGWCSTENVPGQRRRHHLRPRVFRRRRHGGRGRRRHGTVVLGGWGLGGNYIENDSNLAGSLGVLTIGPGITVHGKTGSV